MCRAPEVLDPGLVMLASKPCFACQARERAKGKSYCRECNNARRRAEHDRERRRDALALISLRRKLAPIAREMGLEAVR